MRASVEQDVDGRSASRSRPIDLAAERARTPGCHPVTGRPRLVHLNAAGAALPTTEVLDAVLAHLRREAEMGGYEAAVAMQDELRAVYTSAATVLGCPPDDIALVESATVGWHRVIDALGPQPGERILATRSTYVSMALNLLELGRRRSVEIEILPTAADGRVDLDALRSALARPAAFVTASHVPTSSGLIEPVPEIGALSRAANVPFVLDATQSVGQLPVDVGLIGADALVATGRKFLRGPRGTGLLYVSPGLRARSRSTMRDVRGTAWSGARDYRVTDTALGLETWEASHALRLGLGAALDQLATLGVERVAAYLDGLGRRLRAGLDSLPHITVHDPAASGGGIVTFSRAGEDPVQTQRRLALAGFAVVCVPASHGQWDLGPRGVGSVVRASVHVYNGPDDVDALLSFLAESQSAPAVRARAGVARDARRPARSSAPRANGADVIVVGAGVHGLSAAYHLARRGLRVLQFEQFGSVHAHGSSHGRTRMIRRAYPNPVWDGLLDTAYTAWADLERAAGCRLLDPVGGLYARPLDEPRGLRGPGCEEVDAARAAEIFPGLRLGPRFRAVFDPAAGVLDAQAAMAALRALGARHGVRVHPHTPVLSYTAAADGVEVHTVAGDFSADCLVVCAGPWTGTLIKDFDRVLDVTRLVNIHLGAADTTRLSPPGLGVFSVAVPGAGLLYGIPAYRGAGLKIGLEPGRADDLSGDPGPPTAAEIDRLRELARQFLPAADGPVTESLSCRYTMAPGSLFAVGAVPGSERVLLAAACSGHGFKFGPAVGAALADLATGISRPDLDFLAPERMLARE
jgi:selenocysteine lyase/cysteine desulfurase/glycine/D-amino acid oxidase-like deaminating enzyme